MASDGWRFVAPLLVLSALLLVVQFYWAGGFFLLLAFCVGWFFRDFERKPVKDPGLLLAPADGKVGFIEEVDIETPEGEVLRRRRVSIVLTIFDVHVQRSPVWGRVRSVVYKPGKFLNAVTNDKSSEENEHNMIWIDSQAGPVGVKQIAGLVARRVLCWTRAGETVKMGQRIGLIRFGSRVEAFLPMEAELRVKVGSHVYGATSALAELPREATRAQKEPADE
ncbi:MAG: phosphatidylserine decarboxylase [Candidatus Sumerlaeota bacterium]